jgi:hypothetical protein
MKQAIHIFKKDARYLWKEIAAVLVTETALTLSAVSGASGHSLEFPAQLLTGLLPMAWWFFIARLIHAEPLVGDSQFWVSRPYWWKSLLLSKGLSIALFLNLPKLISDCMILRAYGFEITPNAAGLAWSQALLVAVFVVPVAALASVTAGLTQLALIMVLFTALATSGWAMIVSRIAGASMPWFGVEWIQSYTIGFIVAVAAIVILIWQYRRRDTRACRLVAGCAAVIVLIASEWFPYSAAFAAQSRVTGNAGISPALRIDFDPDLKWATRALVDGSDTVDLNIALRISGVPNGLTARIERIVAGFEGDNGARWRIESRPEIRTAADGALTVADGAIMSLHAAVSSSFYRQVKDKPLRIRGSAYLTLYGNPKRTDIPLSGRPVFRPVAGVGLCSIGPTRVGLNVACRSALRTRPDALTLGLVGATDESGRRISASGLNFTGPASFSYSPFPASFNLTPVDQSVRLVAFSRVFAGASRVAIYATEPVAHISRPLEIDGLRLADYETHPLKPSFQTGVSELK